MKNKSSLLIILIIGILFFAAEASAEINRGLGLGLFCGYAKAEEAAKDYQTHKDAGIHNFPFPYTLVSRLEGLVQATAVG